MRMSTRPACATSSDHQPPCRHHPPDGMDGLRVPRWLVLVHSLSSSSRAAGSWLARPRRAVQCSDVRRALRGLEHRPAGAGAEATIGAARPRHWQRLGLQLSAWVGDLRRWVRRRFRMPSANRLDPRHGGCQPGRATRPSTRPNHRGSERTGRPRRASDAHGSGSREG